MELKVTAEPALEPVTTAEARAHLRIDGTDLDTQIARWIKSARRRAEAFTGRQFITATWTLKLDGWPPTILVPRPPLISVTSLKYVDTGGTEQTLVEDTDYDVTNNTPWRGRVLPSYSKTWPTARAHVNAVELIYTAGYGAAASDVPEDIVQAILLMVGEHSEFPEGLIVGTIAQGVPGGAVHELLWPYRDLEGL